MLIGDKLAQQAFDWLRENADKAAHAKAMRVKAEYTTKKVKATQFLIATGSVAKREAMALTSEAYQLAIDDEVRAIEADEYFRTKRGAAEAIIDGWRTEQSNYRAMGKVG